jgi:hypothetical protein
MTEEFGLASTELKKHLAIDYERAKLKGLPSYELDQPVIKTKKQGVANKRQLMHS